jgi:hypothetical protein
VRTAVRPKASIARANAASKVVSRSWRRNRACASSGRASRTTKTKRIRQVSVGTGKKSMATVEPTWFSRNVRQVCEGGVRRRGISREIVRSDTSNPSFNNSP